MIELKQYPIGKDVLQHLPPFYHFMIYNRLLSKDFEERFGSFSDKYNGTFIIRPAEKSMSQIIDFTPLNPSIQNELLK